MALNIFKKDLESNIIKIIVIGDKGVGKSSWVEKLTTGKFKACDVVSICVEEHLHEFKNEGKTYKLHFYVIPGDEEFQKDFDYLFKDADFFLALYDSTSSASFNKAVNMVNNIIKGYIKNMGKSKNVIFICNKCDLNDNCGLNGENVWKILGNNNFKNIKTSAKSGLNIEKVVKTFLDMLII
jgi:small GTP-binding protein